MYFFICDFSTLLLNSFPTPQFVSSSDILTAYVSRSLSQYVGSIFPFLRLPLETSTSTISL